MGSVLRARRGAMSTPRDARSDPTGGARQAREVARRARSRSELGPCRSRRRDRDALFPLGSSGASSCRVGLAPDPLHASRARAGRLLGWSP